ncbi:hypothetical protein B0H14DRAFT_3493963 [Mycena olivaceomarginata]|nr:hypothetical protein B0H14DRAFT_3493963 [Mycena olivaceomarginata]
MPRVGCPQRKSAIHSTKIPFLRHYWDLYFEAYDQDRTAAFYTFVLHKYIDRYGFTPSNQPATQFQLECARPATLADRALLSVTRSRIASWYRNSTARIA